MSRRWLLSLLCLFVPLLLFVQLTGARGVLRVDEASCRILFQKEPAEVNLVIENLSGEALNSRVQVELLDPRDQIAAQSESVLNIARGRHTLVLSLPLYVSRLSVADLSHLPLFRLRYRIEPAAAPKTIAAEGIVALSAITPDLFALRVAASDVVIEGGRYRARVQAVHPITDQPAAGVSVAGKIVLDDDDRDVTLQAAGLTDATGYALLEFRIPAAFPHFPHTLQPAGGEIHVKGQRGALVAEAENQVLVNQFAQFVISTDKPLYQPGQVLHVRALVMRPSRHVLANQVIVFKISDPEGSNVFRTSIKSTRFGVAAADWPIPENIKLGDYRITVAFDGLDQDQAMSNVRISRYDLPNFSVKVEPDRKYYLRGQNAVVRVRADYLFGQPVARGHVRVVRESEREWNYREQKWEIEEGDKYEGETDANGVYTTLINLAEAHSEMGNEDYRRFRDVSYAAYFTDPTTRRTEQRRFDLRVTKQAIHVYVIADDDSYYYRLHTTGLPLQFYVSTFYADGSPAQCTVTIALDSKSSPSGERKNKPGSGVLRAIRTNRYGLAKVSGLPLPKSSPDDGELNLSIKARDLVGRTGSETKELSVDDEPTVRVETAKTLYHVGEPITAVVTASTPEQIVFVDLVSESTVIQSERLQLHGGRGVVTFPYRAAFKDQITVAAYQDFADHARLISSRTILYPRNHDLKVDLQSTQVSYRPGEDAGVSLRMRAPGGQPAEGVLGIVIFDKAVEERSRTDADFGSNSYGFFGSLLSFGGDNEQFAGVTLRQLEHLDMTRPVPPDLDLLAAVFLNQNNYYRPEFFRSERFETDDKKVFGDTIKQQLEPMQEALAARYARTGEYPRDETSLRRELAASGIDLDSLRDPWGRQYYADFAVNKQADEFDLRTAGPDKRLGTGDDFVAKSMSWAYFRPVGEAIDQAARKYHERTGGLIRDLGALRNEVGKEGIDLDLLRDRWNQPYRFAFEVNERHFEIKVRSGGPDRQFTPERSWQADDFLLWTTSLDYFAAQRAQIDLLLSRRLKATNHFPQNESELAEALQNSPVSLPGLRDLWNHPYYATFRIQASYADSLRIANEAPTGSNRTQITPVTRKVMIINLRSSGADGKAGTLDDFDVAAFTGVLSEQSAADEQPRVVQLSIVLSDGTGAITGRVLDPNGAVVPGATVTASGNSQTYTTTTDSGGKYVLANLLAGVYEVRFAAVAFKLATVTGVVVRSSDIATVDIQLEVGAATETVTVSSGAPSVQTKAKADLALIAVRGKNLPRLVTKSGGQISTPRLREYFPETLLWQPSVETDKQGRAQINFKLADNITTWKLAVIGSNEDGQLGTAETEIKAFQPFFVEHDPPRVLTEGDQISLPVVVRNYLERAQSVDLELKPESWFTLLGPAQKRTAVAAGDSARETFDLRAVASIKDGKQRITAVTAERNTNDAIEKPVTVHPNGEEQTAATSDIVGDNARFALNIPATAFPDSQQGELRIYPNLMAHVVEGVEAIMERPYGCGEQTISSTYPSLLLLRQSRRTGLELPHGARAARYLQAGYDRLLNYRDESGGFTYWGRGEPNVALTAYALRFLNEAHDLITVDDKVAAEARAWLLKQQKADGSWVANDYWNRVEDKRRTALLTGYVARVLAIADRVNSPDTVKENSKKVAETAAADSTLAARDALSRALGYLGQRVAEIDEPYLLASYALALLKSGDAKQAAPVIERLRALAHTEAGATYWALETNTPFYGWGAAGRVETTALVVQALIESAQSVPGGVGTAIHHTDAQAASSESRTQSLTPSPNPPQSTADGSQPPSLASPAQAGNANPPAPASSAHQTNDPLVRSGLLFLLKQKDRYGVWYSTQATINVFDALLAVLQESSAGSPNQRDVVELIINQRAVQKIQLPLPTELVAPITVNISQYLKSGNNSVELRRSGGSSPASAQAVASYYVPWSTASDHIRARTADNSALRLLARFDKTQGKVGDEITCHVEAERIGFNGYGMLLAEIGLPPGADVDRASLETALKSSGWAINQYDILPDRVVLYLWPPAGGVNFDFKFRPRFGMNARTAPSVIYDYYNPEARAAVAPVLFAIR